MAIETVPATDTGPGPAYRIDLAGACATLTAWLQAQEGEALDPSTGQIALRAVNETMLHYWADSPEAVPSNSLMMGVGLVGLAEQALWGSMGGVDGNHIPAHVVDVVRRALRLLEGATLPAAPGLQGGAA